MRIEKTRQTESPEHDGMLRALLLWVTNDFFYVIESSIAADFVFQRGVKAHGEPPLYLGMWDF